ncbi:MAG: 50S ribosomal protein L35 [Candidatus Levybacteria bacterium]|jgi:ribosomal protein L35|nr:50S ribosomal protein L35 [Candidatus Levybacteria bacterium]
MNKKKIKGAVSKRFKVTKTGKVLFSHQYGSHKKLLKSKRRIRRQKETGILTGAFAKKIKQMLGEA